MHAGQAPHGGDTLVDIISCYADFHALILLRDGRFSQLQWCARAARRAAAPRPQASMRPTPAVTLTISAVMPAAQTILTSKGAPRQATVRFPLANAPGCSSQPMAISGMPMGGVRPGTVELNNRKIKHRQKTMPRVPSSFCCAVKCNQFNMACFLRKSGGARQARHGRQLQDRFRVGRRETAVGGGQIRHQGQVHEQRVFTTDIYRQLANSLKEW